MAHYGLCHPIDGFAAPAFVPLWRSRKSAVNEADASQVLLTRAIESEDRDGSLIPEPQRRRIAREAGLPPEAEAGAASLSAQEEDYLLRRAGLVLDALGRSIPAVPRTIARLKGGWRIAWALPVAAFVAGALLHDLGAGNAINIVAFPLLGMLLWNLGVYAVLALKQLLRAGDTRRSPSSGLRRLLSRRLGAAATAVRSATDGGVAALALTRFATDWIARGGALAAARAAAILHVSAALLAAGAVAGMYLRGLGFEYRAGWESTFLDAQAVARIVGAVLAPASALSGIELPQAEQWQALRFSPDQPGENAARWIHLYAITAALFIVLPRFVLGIASWLNARRRAADFPLPPRGDPYFRRLLGASPGTAPTVRFVCYSYHLPATGRQALAQLLRDALGEGLRLPDPEIVDYGAEDEYLAQLAGSTAPPADWMVLVFSLAGTPEHETHGRLCDGLAQLVSEGRCARRLLVLVDESAYRGRLGAEAEAPVRLAQRRKAWRNALSGHDAGMIDLAAAGEAQRAVLEALLAGAEQAA